MILRVPHGAEWVGLRSLETVVFGTDASGSLLGGRRASAGDGPRPGKNQWDVNLTTRLA